MKCNENAWNWSAVIGHCSRLKKLELQHDLHCRSFHWAGLQRGHHRNLNDFFFFFNLSIWKNIFFLVLRIYKTSVQIKKTVHISNCDTRHQVWACVWNDKVRVIKCDGKTYLCLSVSACVINRVEMKCVECKCEQMAKYIYWTMKVTVDNTQIQVWVCLSGLSAVSLYFSFKPLLTFYLQ